jgi:ligand-binding sensor domain-containing protein
MRLKKKGLLIFFLLSAVWSWAQIPFFQQYSLLKNKSPLVNALYRDKTGFMWLGTNEGIFKFNGTTFQQFTISDSLPDNTVTAIAEDSLGRIWTGHKNGSIGIIEQGKITKFNPAEGLSTESISDILFDRKGNLWFSTLNDGLYYFTQGRLYRLDKEDGMPDLFIYDLAEDRAGNIWAGTDGGLAICTLKGRNTTIKTIDSRNGLPDNIVRKVEVVENRVWLGTEDAGVFTYDLTTQKFKSIVDGIWKYGYVSDFELKGNQVWISCPQSGLAVFDSREGYLKLYGEKSGSSFMSINALLADREGNIWTASKAGLMRTYGDDIEYIETISPASDPGVVAVAKDKQGTIWFANGEGLFTLRKDEFGATRGERQLENTPYKKYSIISLYVDAAGYIWAGLYGEGVLRINPVSRKIVYLSKELRNGNVLNVTGKGNVVWLATLGGGTQIKIDGEQLNLRNYTRTDGLSTDYIYQIFVDSKNRTWFATDGKGVDMLDDQGFHHYEKGLTSKVIYSITEDANHHMWVNTQSGGLYILDETTFKSMANTSNQTDSEIGSLTADGEGNIVIFHDAGIELYDVDEDRFHAFGESVGMGNRKPNLNAFASDERGHIYFGTDQGIVKYSPVKAATLTVPQPHIESVMVLDKKVDLSKPLDFRYDENYVTINFIGFWFQDEENLNFRYKLNNNDRDWINTRDHSITYSSLSPGRYTFQLEVSEAADFKTAKAVALTFVINPPIWRTPLFYIAVVALFVFAGYSYMKFRERKIRNDKAVLEQMVKERTWEIEKKNLLIQEQTEEIKTMNENLEITVKERTTELEKKNKALEEYAFITAHNLRAPVASVLGLINLMTKLEHDKEAKEIIAHMQQSAERLDTIVSSITRAIEKGD